MNWSIALTLLVVCYATPSTVMAQTMNSAEDLAKALAIVEGYEGEGFLEKNGVVVLKDENCLLRIFHESEHSTVVELRTDDRAETQINIESWDYENPQEYFEVKLSDGRMEYGVQYEDVSGCLRKQAILLGDYSVSLYLERICADKTTSTLSHCEY